jgi:hypothetical protein
VARLRPEFAALVSDVKTFIQDTVVDRLNSIRGALPSLPVPPVAEGAADTIRNNLQALLESEAQELAAAIRASVEAKVSTVRAELTTRVDQLKAQLANRLANAIIGPLNSNYSFYDSWADPLIGLRGRLNLNKTFYLTALTDIGGFGIGSDIAVEAYAALGRQITRNIFSEVGFRYLYDDFLNESVGFLYRLSTYGAQVTIGLDFDR